VQGQPIDSSKEAREFFKKYTDKINLGKPAPPDEMMRTMKELEALAYEIHVVVPFRLEQMLIHGDPKLRRQAARTLAAIGANPFTAGARVDTVMRHLNDRDPEVVEALLLALTFIGPNAKQALPKVLETFKHEDPRVRRQAMVFFTRFLPENKDLMPTIIAALDDPDVGIDEKKPGYGSVSMLALNALIRYGPDAEKTVPKLIQMVKDKKYNDFYEISILNTLVRIKPDEPFTLNIARKWLRRQDSPEHILKGAGLTPRRKDGKPAVPELIAALEIKPFADPNLEQRIKLGLLEALQRIGPDAREALPVLRALAGTRDLTLRRQAEKTIDFIEAAK
jgi:HEAT repeat protein